MHTKMGSDHNLHGVCNTGLELGLGSHDHRTTLGDEYPDLDHRRRHHQESKKKPIMMSLKYDHLLPSDLTLGPIASSSDHDVHDHHQANQSSPVSTENTILHQRASSLSAVSSFSNSSASTTVVKRDREVISGEDDAETNLETSLVSPRVISDNYINNQLEDDQDQGSPRKKLRLTKQQSALLEDSFKEHTTLNPKQKQDLARQLNLRPRQVEVWFQNRRARTKLKQTEADYEQWKKCCETLTEENKRLQKELQELKSLKLITAPFYMPFPAPPPATLTICPSCERIGGGGDSTTRFLIRPKPAHLISNPHPSEAAC